METTVHLTTDTVPLAAVLKLAGVVESGGHAKQLIQAGLVHVNGSQETRRGKRLRAGDIVEIEGDQPVRIDVA